MAFSLTPDARHPVLHATHRWRWPAIAVVVLYLAAFVWPQAGATQPVELAGLDAYIESAMKDWEQPGLAIAVVRDDEIIYARGFGTTMLGGDEPVDEHTLFAIASTTKAFTVAALGILVDEGALHWDDPTRRHMPHYRVADRFVSQEMTIRDMLTHRVGVASHNNVWIAAPFDRREMVRRARHLPQSSGFRSGYSYNNHMYIAAGEIIPAVTGMSWDDFLETRIFRPLGMMRTTTRYAVAEASANVASPHLRVDGRVTPVGRRNYDALGGAGAMFSSAFDMAQWVRMHLGGGVYEGERILSADVVAEMHSPQTPMSLTAQTKRRYPDRTYAAYGLGWRLHDYAGKNVVQHTGTVNFMRTQVGMIPSEGIGVVILGNLTTSNLQTALMYRVFDALLGRSPRDWSAAFRSSSDGSPSSGEPSRVAGTRPSTTLDAYAGVYADSLYGEIRVELEDGGLVLRYSPDYVADLEHWQHDTFRATWRSTGFGSTFAAFEVGADGEVVSIDLRGFTSFSRAQPVATVDAIHEDAAGSSNGP